MRSTRITGGCLVLALVAAACTTGSGNVVTDTRDLGDFEGIDVSGGIEVRVTVDPAATTTVAVVFDDNLLDHIVTDVDGTTLQVSGRGSFNVPGSGRFVEITTPTLTALEASGGSEVTVAGADVESLTLSASGGADADLADLTIAVVDLEASGGASVTVNVTGEITGQASGGADVTILGNPGRQVIDVSGGADVSNE
jgi:hypothetical protein